jgi:hypothetical protein
MLSLFREADFRASWLIILFRFLSMNFIRWHIFYKSESICYTLLQMVTAATCLCYSAPTEAMGIAPPVAIICEGPEKMIREGLNESQSKFLKGTWPIFQNRPDVPLFYLGQDRIPIEKLSALEIRLGTTAETWISVGKTKSEINDKIRIKKSVYVLTVISPNTLRTCSRNNCLSSNETRKSQTFYPTAQEPRRLPHAIIWIIARAV